VFPLRSGPVDDVRMADNPADVGSSPVDVAGIDSINIFHCPLESNGVASVVADDAFGFSCGAGGVQDVERVGSGDRDAALRPGCGGDFVPIEIPAGEKFGGVHGTLEDDAFFRLVMPEANGFVEKRLVRENAVALNAAGGGGDNLGLASSMRAASSCEAKPPKTTECTAPRRAQASIAIAASGTMGR